MNSRSVHLNHDSNYSNRNEANRTSERSGAMKDPVGAGISARLHTSTGEAVTKQIRSDLLDGTIPAGSRVLAKSLAERFRVSIVPVREAIKRLEAEGLLVSSPQRATFAAEIGLADIAGVYDVRQILEVELARRAVTRADDAALKKCDDALASLLSAELCSPDFFEAHRWFHWCLIEPASGKAAQAVLERLWTNVDRFMAIAIKSMNDEQEQEYKEQFRKIHTQLARTFGARDEEGLRQLLKTHLHETEESLKAAFSNPAWQAKE